MLMAQIFQEQHEVKITINKSEKVSNVMLALPFNDDVHDAMLLGNSAMFINPVLLGVGGIIQDFTE